MDLVASQGEKFCKVYAGKIRGFYEHKFPLPHLFPMLSIDRRCCGVFSFISLSKSCARLDNGVVSHSSEDYLPVL